MHILSAAHTIVVNIHNVDYIAHVPLCYAVGNRHCDVIIVLKILCYIFTRKTINRNVASYKILLQDLVGIS